MKHTQLIVVIKHQCAVAVASSVIAEATCQRLEDNTIYNGWNSYWDCSLVPNKALKLTRSATTGGRHFRERLLLEWIRYIFIWPRFWWCMSTRYFVRRGHESWGRHDENDFSFPVTTPKERLTFHFFWPGSTPHQSLSVWSDKVHNLSDLWLKSHVQHAVSFIQDLCWYR